MPLRDVRHACRSIARMPVLASVIIVSLGAGIGVNTVVFSWIQSVTLKPIPGVVNSAAFYMIEPSTDSGVHPGVSWLEFRDLQEQLRTFQPLLAYRMVPLYVGESGRVERGYGMLVSGNYFSALGLQPSLGRFFLPADVARPGGEPVAVISYAYWKDHFGSDPQVVGRTFRVNSRDLTVIGVSPQGFHGTVMRMTFDIWLPATLAPVVFNESRELEDRSSRGYAVMGRLQPSTTKVDAQHEVSGAMQQLAMTYPQTNAAMTAEIRPFSQPLRGPQRFLIAALTLLQSIMLVLLLAVCGNTANLVLARASVRQREMGIRLALGAGPWRIIGVMLTENIIIALAGAALGTAIAMWGTQAMPNIRLNGLPLNFKTEVDGAGLAFAIGLGVLSGLLFGAAPAAQLARVDPLRALRAGARTATRSRLRDGLMGVQVALAIVVLIAAALFFRSFIQAHDTNTGFRRDGILLTAYDLTGRADPKNATFQRTFADQLINRLRALPSIENAAVASAVPLDIHGLPSRSFAIDGRARTDRGSDEALSNTVTPGYFKTLDIAFKAGRDFADLKDLSAPPQAIVNEEFVRRYVPGGDCAAAPGRWLQSRGGRYVIVGVVQNSIYNAFGESPIPIIYLSYRDRPSMAGEIHLRVRTGSEAAVTADVRQVVRELDPDLPLYSVRTLNEHIENNLIFRSVPARMFSVLGPLLLALAAIGIYAVVAYTVSHRTTEIGVRLALGATARRVVIQFVAESLVVIGVGGVFGWLAAFIIALDFVPQGSIDVPAFVGVPVVLLVVATVACWIPARRATRLDPMVALRHE
jgi:putative ABC transport system permease protein